MKKIGIVMGSASDLPVVKKAIDMLDQFEVPYEVHVYSAHRTPDHAADFASAARSNGFGAIIAAAGMAAHLAGAIAAENIAAAVATGADVIDVNSSLETAPGVKSVGRLDALLGELRRA